MSDNSVDKDTRIKIRNNLAKIARDYFDIFNNDVNNEKEYEKTLNDLIIALADEEFDLNKYIDDNRRCDRYLNR